MSFKSVRFTKKQKLKKKRKLILSFLLQLVYQCLLHLNLNRVFALNTWIHVSKLVLILLKKRKFSLSANSLFLNTPLLSWWQLILPVCYETSDIRVAIPPVVVNINGVKVPCSVCKIHSAYFRFFSFSCLL